jgi:hypothetical protein
MAQKQGSSLPAQLVREATRRAKEAEKQHRAQADELVRRVEERTGSVAAAFYDIGEALSRLRDRRLYASLGHKTFDELLAKRLEMSRAQAYRFIAVAERMPRSRATELGPRRSIALLRLADATPGLDSVEDLLRNGVTLPGRAGPVRVADLSVEELERAARTVARAHRPHEERVSSSEERNAETFAKRVRERLTNAGVSPCKVEIHRRARPRSPEELLLRIEVPHAARATLAAALKAR